METIIVKRDNERDIKFIGKKIASVASYENDPGSIGHWNKLFLYRTKGGKYICEKFDCTVWGEEKIRREGCICGAINQIDQIIEFFGTGYLAKELYETAGIDTAIEVE